MRRINFSNGDDTGGFAFGNEVGGGQCVNSTLYSRIFSLEREFAAKFHWVGWLWGLRTDAGKVIMGENENKHASCRQINMNNKSLEYFLSLERCFVMLCSDNLWTWSGIAESHWRCTTSSMYAGCHMWKIARPSRTVKSRDGTLNTPGSRLGVEETRCSFGKITLVRNNMCKYRPQLSIIIRLCCLYMYIGYRLDLVVRWVARLSLALAPDCLRLTARLKFSHHAERGKLEVQWPYRISSCHLASCAKSPIDPYRRKDVCSSCYGRGPKAADKGHFCSGWRLH